MFCLRLRVSVCEFVDEWNAPGDVVKPGLGMGKCLDGSVCVVPCHEESIITSFAWMLGCGGPRPIFFARRGAPAQQGVSNLAPVSQCGVFACLPACLVGFCSMRLGFLRLVRTSLPELARRLAHLGYDDEEEGKQQSLFRAFLFAHWQGRQGQGQKAKRTQRMERKAFQPAS